MFIDVRVLCARLCFSRNPSALLQSSILQKNKCELCSAAILPPFHSLHSAFARPPKASKESPQELSRCIGFSQIRNVHFIPSDGKSDAQACVRDTHVYARLWRPGTRLNQRAVSVAQPTQSFTHLCCGSKQKHKTRTATKKEEKKRCAAPIAR